MACILVEVDIHGGLMESFELEWRRQVIVQQLDYQGFPFRCSSCRRTGHLRHDCPSWNESGDVDDSMETQVNDLYMSDGDA